LKACEGKTIKSSVDEPPEVELKDLPPHLEYAFLEVNNKLPDTPFIFFEDCIKSFQTLKQKLMEAPILIALNWDLPFELMCDASDFAIEYSQEVLGFFDVTASGNPTPYDDSIMSTTSPTLALFGDSDFLLFEEADAFLGLEDDPNSPEFDPFYYESEGVILLPEDILNSEPSPPPQS
nr:reverse transcriptase domain-containing protein [Tanacetum cinerariifolium]